jgi:ribose transport system permease protein
MKKLGGQAWGVFAAWVAVYALFAFLKPGTFLTLGNLELMMRQSLIIGLGAVGMTYIIMSGGIDLSAGSAAALATVVGALTLNATQDPTLAALACVGVGLGCGLVNGLATALLKAGPFIVTLGSMLAFRGLAKGLAGEKTVSTEGDSWIFSLASALDSQERWLLIPIGGWIWLILLGLMALALKRTTFGRRVVAIGSNEEAARLCGVKVEAVKVGVYSLAGVFFGLGGLMSLSRMTLGDPTSSQGDELKIIAAVVIGGASLSGGQGSLLGAAFGVLIMTTIGMGCTQMGIPNWVQEIMTGAIILSAVALDRWRISRAGQ